MLSSEVGSFSNLGLAENVLRAVVAEGYTTPTPIQAESIPHLVAGRDLLGVAQTGTGKTAAFSLPILTKLSKNYQVPPQGRIRRLRALILAPTRELAAQIGESLAVYGRHTGLRHAVIFGGVNQFHQVRSLRQGIDIVVATPGRLLDLMNQGHCNLSGVDTLVLDEADRMFDMGFLPDLKRIVSRLPQQRQTLLFSATMPGPIDQLAQSVLRDPARVFIAPQQATIDLIEQHVYFVQQNGKQQLLENILGDIQTYRAIVFTRTKHGADRVVKQLAHAGINSAAIHGNKSQSARQKVLEAFRGGRLPVLVATDLAARGLDIDGVTHVFNFDLPTEPESYVHRVGRTGRAGATGVAIAFCSGDERGSLRDIERLTRQRLRVQGTPELQAIGREVRVDEGSSDVRRPQGQSRQPQGRRPQSRPAQSRPATSRPAQGQSGQSQTRSGYSGTSQKPHAGQGGQKNRRRRFASSR